MSNDMSLKTIENKAGYTAGQSRTVGQGVMQKPFRDATDGHTDRLAREGVKSRGCD